jgi:hypothetical protein
MAGKPLREQDRIGEKDGPRVSTESHTKAAREEPGQRENPPESDGFAKPQNGRSPLNIAAC